MARTIAAKLLLSVTKALVDEYSVQLRRMLEEKHLYQSVSVDNGLIKSKAVESLDPGWAIMYDAILRNWEGRRLIPATKLALEQVIHEGTHVQVWSPILLVTNTKLFCNSCKSSEVFSPVWSKDAASESLDHLGKGMPRNDGSQLIFIAFQCQRCQSDPEGFIVRRSKQRFYLEGRSPIEHVDTPAFLPKQEVKYYGDAIVAFNAGKKLAGLFYLRVFLEQFCRRVTGLSGRVSGEELMEAYSATLPKEHRDYMPSFREWYEKLSGALHSASEDDFLFESAKGEIERHFDIRRIFKIAESPARTE